MSEQAQTPAVVVPAEASSFSYEPPKSEATQDELAEFNDLLKGTISDISDEYADKSPEVEPVEGQEAPAEPVALDEAKSSERPEIARGMQQLVQREVALQAREAQFAGKEQEVAGLRQELTSLRAAVPTKDLLEKFDLSPSDALKAMGKDPETVVRLMIAEQLHAKGQPVPEGLQKFIEKATDQRRIAALEAKIADRDRAAQEAQTFSAVQAGGREYVKKIDGKKMPSLAEIAKTDPELAHSELMEEIERQVSKNPNGQLTYDSAAAQAETRLARLVKAMGGFAANKGSGNSTQPMTPVSGQKPTPPQTKAPAKPLRPWERKQSDLDAAINDAVGEFHRSEAAQKAARK